MIISFGGKNKGKLLRRILWIQVWRKLREVNNRNNIKGLFSIWLGECALLGKRFGEKYNIVHKTWIVGQDARPGNKYVMRMKPAAGELIAVSDFIANEFFANYLIKPIQTIPNGVDTTQFHPAPAERTIDVMGAGSLIVLKQYHLFISIIRELKKDYPAIESFIAGNGPEKESLQSLITNLQLEDNISLPDEIAHGTLLGLMQRSKIFLHPSCYEGLSMSCLEALYAGCHVISFCKPMEEDIEHWHIVKTKEEMLAKVLELLAQPGLECKTVVPYSIDEAAKCIMKLYVD
jgi:glycosyltransferase involved in cell wall biosynthesis